MTSVLVKQPLLNETVDTETEAGGCSSLLKNISLKQRTGGTTPLVNSNSIREKHSSLGGTVAPIVLKANTVPPFVKIS